MYDYLFICAANVGRSQMAEALYNHHTRGHNSISAAGLVDVREKYKHRPHKGIIKTMSEIGIDISQNEVKLISPELIQQAKKVIVLFEKEECNPTLTKLLNGTDVEYIHVEDPYSKYPQINSNDKTPTFRKSREIIDKIIKGL